MTTTITRPVARSRFGKLPVVGLLVLGVIVIPVALAMLTTSHTTPDAEAYARMAFGVVAGQTIAIVTVVGLVIASIMRRFSIGAVLANVLIAAVVIAVAASTIGSAMASLLLGLGLGS